MQQPPLVPMKEVIVQALGMAGAIPPAGGSTVITVTPGAALTTVDTVPIGPPGFSSVTWVVELEKAASGFSTETITAQTDGASATALESNLVFQPGSGTYDYTWSVAVSGGNLLLQITPASAGWTVRAVRLVELPT